MVTSSLVGGGAEKLNITLANYLINQGHKVCLVVLSSRRVDYQITNFKVHFLDESFQEPKFKILKNYYRKKGFIKLLDRLEHENNSSFDVILASLYNTHKLFEKINRPNVFYWIHTVLSKELERYEDDTKYLKKKQAYQKTYQNKPLLVTSNGVKQDLIDEFNVPAKHIHVFYNFFDFQDIQNRANQPIKLPVASKKYLIHVGRFSKPKRHDVLLEAYKLAKTELPLVLLCKDSPELQLMIQEKGLQSKVMIAGFQQNPYVWMKNAKLMVLTSDYEGFGNVIVESLFLNTPVVSTDCKAGPREILIAEFAKFLGRTGDADDMASKINYALENDFKFEQLKLEERFSVSVFVKKLFATL